MELYNFPKLISLLFHGHLVPFLSGTENGALVFMRDITARKQAELTLSRRNDELNTANAQLAATAKELKQNYEELSDNQRQLI